MNASTVKELKRGFKVLGSSFKEVFFLIAMKLKLKDILLPKYHLNSKICYFILILLFWSDYKK